MIYSFDKRELNMSNLESITNLFNKSHANHLNHPEENTFLLHGFMHSYKTLYKLYDFLSYKDMDVDMDVTVKMDGSPSVVFGYHPITKMFFVGTKSVFNKKPKICYTEDDIVEHHSHSEGLVQKLKDALLYLPHITPCNYVIYQCDVLFSKEDKIEFDKLITFTPNTISYLVDESNKNFDAVKNAQFGIAVHTCYMGQPYSKDSLEGLTAYYASDVPKLISNKLVYQSNINFNRESVKYKRLIPVVGYLEEARQIHETFSAKDLEAINHHAIMLKAYFNHNLKNSISYHSITDYFTFSNKKLQRDIDRMSSTKGKERKTAIKDNFLMHITLHTDLLYQALDIYHNIQDAKDALVHVMNDTEQQYGQYINNNKTMPEGYVAVLDGIPTKLVHRHEFSKLNFINSINR